MDLHQRLVRSSPWTKIALTLSSAVLATRFKRKFDVLLGLTLISIAAASTMYALPRDPGHQRDLLAALMVLYLSGGMLGVLSSWM